jgi:GrpB-like predicted nucleotidyltransferase (UPF0157 family)
VRVQLIYVPPGGLIGRHEATARQLLAIVAGTGWVSGAEGARREVRAGFGALWEPGEVHETGSDTGLTAVCIEGEFEDWSYSVTKEIVVVGYDPRWPSWFEQIRDHVWPAVEGRAVRVDHVGSTAVPDLAAKPIIDADIVVESEDDVQPVIEALAAIGYRWRGDLGVEGRQAFSHVPTDGGPTLPVHHLYLVVHNNRAHVDHWLLRDLLREDAVARARYSDLKRRNAEAANEDIDVYVESKAELVAELLTRARAERGMPAVAYWRP